jgi:polysaccharide biosynthesis protein PslF
MDEIPVDSLAMVSTFAPTRCGIATFTASLARAISSRGRHADVIRAMQHDDASADDPIVRHEYDPSHPGEVARASQLLDGYRTVLVQHEFGIFGPGEGRSVVDLLSGIGATVITTLHTVPLQPTHEHQHVLRGLAKVSDRLIVPSHAARKRLITIFGIQPEHVTVVPHGSSWGPSNIRRGPRSRLLTWGLLGPGKGIERAIEAVAKLRGADMKGDLPHYRIVGQTHPNVTRREGYRYRDQLLDLIAAHRLQDRVTLDDGYKSDADLYSMVTESDLVVVPYDNREQISSGVLTEALSAGKPVIATRFPHAEELLSRGSGIIVDHDDIDGMSHSIRILLEDDIAYHRAAATARAMSKEFRWTSVARSYLDVAMDLWKARRVG